MTVDRASTVAAHSPPAPVGIAAVEQLSPRSPIQIKVGLPGHSPRATDPATSCRAGTSSPGPMGPGSAMHDRQEKHGGQMHTAPIS